MPFTAKDLNDATPYPTTYGSRAFAGGDGDRRVGDAACIARLRRAGAVLIGKTNTPEMGLRPTTENLLFGPTRNPHDTARTPGGSSGGAAAALAAGIGTLAQGSDGGGSIRIPAACCGVVGHKPTRGLVSGAPASYDGWEGFATNGPMARTVADCALMLEVMAGPEPGDTYAAPPHDGAFAAACVEDPAPLALGVIHDPPAGILDDEVAAIFDAALELLAHMGHRVEDAEAPLAAVMEPFHTIVLGQTAAFRQMLPPERYELLEPTTRAAVTDGERIGVGEYVRPSRRRGAATAAMLEALAPFELVVCPVLTRPAVPLDEFPLAAPRRELWRELLRLALLHRPVQRHGPACALAPDRGDRRAACRSACRSSARSAPTHSCSPSAPRSSERSREPGRPRRRRGRGATRERALSATELTERLPRAHPRARRRAQPRGRPRLDQRLGARLRGGGARAGGTGRRDARAGRRAAAPLVRHPDRAQGSLRRRRAST